MTSAEARKKSYDELTGMLGKRIHVGDIYIDCADHPCIATESSKANDELAGISLINGTGPRLCSFRNCSPVKMKIPLAMWFRNNWDVLNEPNVKKMVKLGFWKRQDNHYRLKDWSVIRKALMIAGFGKKLKTMERYL